MIELLLFLLITPFFPSFFAYSFLFGQDYSSPNLPLLFSLFFLNSVLVFLSIFLFLKRRAVARMGFRNTVRKVLLSPVFWLLALALFLSAVAVTLFYKPNL